VIVSMNIDMLMIEEQGKNTSNSESVSRMVDNICSQVDQLDAARRYMFMEWLLIHSHEVNRTGELRESLIAWLRSMPAESADWEYKLILTETKWWQDLDEPRLLKIMSECLGNKS
jgi:hypothetical protein